MDPRTQAETVVRRLKQRGYNVIVDDMPGRPWPFTPNAVLLHHTASTSTTSVSLEKADVAYIKRDAPDGSWPAPHAQWYVGRTGRIYLLCKGGANHAGSGSLASDGIPQNLGNQFMWGIENQSKGLTRDWTKEEWNSCHALTGELLTVMGVGVARIWRHKDYSDAGKIDTQYPLDAHREAVRQYLNQEDDEMKPEDFQKIRAIVADEIEKAVPDIADKVTKDLLSKDLFPKKEDIELTVREALRKGAK